MYWSGPFLGHRRCGSRRECASQGCQASCRVCETISDALSICTVAVLLPSYAALCLDGKTVLPSVITSGESTELQTFDLRVHTDEIRIIPKFRRMDEFINIKEVCWNAANAGSIYDDVVDSPTSLPSTTTLPCFATGRKSEGSPREHCGSRRHEINGPPPEATRRGRQRVVRQSAGMPVYLGWASPLCFRRVPNSLWCI